MISDAEYTTATAGVVKPTHPMKPSNETNSTINNDYTYCGDKNST